MFGSESEAKLSQVAAPADAAAASIPIDAMNDSRSRHLRVLMAFPPNPQSHAAE
jgi:hypothetical protein